MRKERILSVAVALTVGVAVARPHVLRMDGPALEPEEGFVLGNGDLSVCAYQTADTVVFRFGKGDVWDRRIEKERDPAPATVRDYIDIALGRKPAGDFTRRSHGVGQAYPMPKPVGELKLHIPSNLPGFPKWTQQLFLEEGKLRIAAVWPNGVNVGIEAVMDPVRNEFACTWKCTGWDEETRVGRGEPPVWYSLEREADPVASDFAASVASVGLSNAARSYPDAPPLPPPVAIVDVTNALYCIDQAFYPDRLFPDGFTCRLQLCVGKDGGRALPVAAGPKRAMLHFFGWSRDVSGSAVVKVTTTRDVQRGATWPTYERPQPFKAYLERAKAAAEAYWAKSAVTFPDDPSLEDLWYATYHLRRCFLRGGTVPPGLFHPCSLRHYSHWHGDYHANYNLESIYWGEFTANRCEQAEAFFDAVDFYRPVGRLIAEKYYGCRGVFIQLEGFPALCDDDYNGRLTLGRMVYMTGWFASRYWDYYAYTLDRDWLKTRGYPFLRECALFYLDFLKKAPHPDLPPNLNDGKYHVFPSIAGEATLGKDPMRLCDQWSPLAFARHALYVAAEAARTLGVDADLVRDWTDRYENLAGPGATAKGYARHCLFAGSPEYGGVPQPYVQPGVWDGKPLKHDDRDFWYFGLAIRDWLGRLRQNRFLPARDYPRYRSLLEKWRRPNGSVRAMSVAHYGRTGGWTETLSCMAPVQEMALQSWDGAIRLFPLWPADRAIAFRDWRAQGAFLVSAAFADGQIGDVTIRSEKGADCRIWGDWAVAGPDGAPVPTRRDEFDRLVFATRVGEVYRLLRK